MSTTRERREARAERLRDWADKREAKAETSFAKADQMASAIPMGQPILVGHYSEGRDRRYRARIESNGFAGVEHSRKAESMRSRADTIEAAADQAIYSDDPDAIERLEVKLSELETKRAGIKAHNAAERKRAKAAGDLAEVMPAYVLSNLSGNIKRTRDRIAGLRRDAERAAAGIKKPARVFVARFGGECIECGATIEKGETIYYRGRCDVTCGVCES